MTHAQTPEQIWFILLFTAMVSKLKIWPKNKVTSKIHRSEVFRLTSTKFDKNGFFSVVQGCWSTWQVGSDCHPRPARPEGDRYRLGSQDQQDRHLLGRQERICLEP